MNKKEKSTILSSYKNIFKCEYVLGLDVNHIDFQILLDNLDLKKERFETENEVISEENKYKSNVIEMFNKIAADFIKYGKFIKFEIDKVDDIFYNLQFEMTDFEVSENEYRIDYIRRYTEKEEN